jgi:hypothetical protein
MHPQFGRGLLIAERSTESGASYVLDFDGLGRKTVPASAVQPAGEGVSASIADDVAAPCAGLALVGPPNPVRVDAHRDKLPAGLVELLERWGPGWIGGEFSVLVPGDASWTDYLRIIREEWAESGAVHREPRVEGVEHAWTALEERTWRRMIPIATAAGSRAVITYTRAPDEAHYFCDPDRSFAVRAATSFQELVTWLVGGGLDSVAAPGPGARYGLPAIHRTDGPYAGEEAELFRVALLSGERIEAAFEEWMASAPKWLLVRELAELLMSPACQAIDRDLLARWTERAVELARLWNPAVIKETGLGQASRA